MASGALVTTRDHVTIMTLLPQDDHLEVDIAVLQVDQLDPVSIVLFPKSDMGDPLMVIRLAACSSPTIAFRRVHSGNPWGRTFSGLLPRATRVCNCTIDGVPEDACGSTTSCRGRFPSRRE